MGGGVEEKLARKDYTRKQTARSIKFVSRAAGLLRHAICLVLLLGLSWCSHYLIPGIVEPEVAEYTNSMLELVIAVLGVISIMFVLVRFIRRKE